MEHGEAYLRIGLVMSYSLNYKSIIKYYKSRNALNIESVKKKHMNIVLKKKD